MFLLFVILSNPDCKSYGLEYGIANPVQRDGASCCRMAVSEEDQLPFKPEVVEKESTVKVVPNPGQNRIVVQTNSNWEKFIILDVKGRVVAEGKGFKKEFLLPTEKLPNGLYRVILSNRKETKSANFQILK